MAWRAMLNRAASRREFLVGLGGVAAALAARGLSAQQSNFVPMDQGAYRPVLRTPKPNAVPLLDDAARDAFEKKLKCQCSCILDVYTCRTTDFTCSVSPAMHRDVVRLISGGYDESEILAAFVEVYGEVVLTAPVKQGFNWLGYFAPALALATGGVVLTMMLRRWSRDASGPAPAAGAARHAPPPGATDEEMQRLERALREDG